MPRRVTFCDSQAPRKDPEPVKGTQGLGPTRSSSTRRDRSSRPKASTFTSTTLVRLVAPVTRLTSRRRTPSASASAASADSVARPSTARAVTATTRAPSRSPPTRDREEPGLTRMVTRTRTVPGPGRTVATRLGRPGEVRSRTELPGPPSGDLPPGHSSRDSSERQLRSPKGYDGPEGSPLESAAYVPRVGSGPLYDGWLLPAATAAGAGLCDRLVGTTAALASSSRN